MVFYILNNMHKSIVSIKERALKTNQKNERNRQKLCG